MLQLPLTECTTYVQLPSELSNNCRITQQCTYIYGDTVYAWWDLGHQNTLPNGDITCS